MEDMKVFIQKNIEDLNKTNKAAYKRIDDRTATMSEQINKLIKHAMRLEGIVRDLEGKIEGKRKNKGRKVLIKKHHWNQTKLDHLNPIPNHTILQLFNLSNQLSLLSPNPYSPHLLLQKLLNPHGWFSLCPLPHFQYHLLLHLL